MTNGHIPVLGIPIYNRVDLLLRCLRSIDFPVELLVIVNNGDLPVPELHEPVWSEVDVNEFIGAVQIFEPIFDPGVPGKVNMGVAGAWNYLLHQHGQDYVLICNNDIQWAAGDLEKMHACVRLSRNLHAVFGNFSYSNFLVTAAGRDFIGYFDENFWPAYLEDGDHWRRIVLSGANICHAVGVNALHGEDGKTGSCTIHSDPELARANHETHGNNWEYYRRKWGFVDEIVRETYRYPFDDPQQSLNDWCLTEERRRLPYYFGSSEEAAEASLTTEVTEATEVGG